jgi:Uma2 family endonuclease
MIAQSHAARRYTVEEYLDLEEAAPEKSEYWFGQIVAMAGTTEAHSLITMNLSLALTPQLRKRRCKAYTNDLKIGISPSGPLCYPDYSAVSGQPLFLSDKRTVLLNPVLVVEVLSRSTESRGRGDKFEQYQTISSLQQIVFIAQDKPRVEVYTRTGDLWTFQTASGVDEMIELPAIECSLNLEDIYYEIALPDTPALETSIDES